jgi:hypothetical protein
MVLRMDIAWSVRVAERVVIIWFVERVKMCSIRLSLLHVHCAGVAEIVVRVVYVKSVRNLIESLMG